MRETGRTTSGGCRFCADRSRTKIRTVRVRRSPSLRETGCWKSSGLPLAPTEVERRYEPFESGRTRLYPKGILLGYLLYIRRARDGTRTRDPDLGKVVLHQLSHSRIKMIFTLVKSARRDSNPRPRPWQGRAPPTEPLAHKKCYSQAHGYYTI